MALINECIAAGIDPCAVEKIAKRLNRVMKDADKIGVSLFCGGSNTLRANDGNVKLLIVSHLDFLNSDGGDGGCCEDENGLLRGE